MRITIDTDKRILIEELVNQIIERPLYSKESFEILSDVWIKVGWNEKYSYTFSWMGRPIIQLPEDMIRVQEVIYELKPDVIIETGVAHGGSLIFYGSLCKAMNHGRVIGVDIEIRPVNRKAIEDHELSSYITLVEGDSVSEATLSHVHSIINEQEKVLVILDSNHSKEHVAKELEAFQNLVSEGSYIVVTDGIMKDLFDTPRGEPNWKHDNPVNAVEEFIDKYPHFKLAQPNWSFNESKLNGNITHWPSAWLKKERV